MDKELCIGKSHKDKLNYLQTAADEVIEKEYYTQLSPDEIVINRKTYIDNAIGISNLEEEKKGVLADYKEQIQPMKVENKELERELSTGLRKIKGKLYKFVDAPAKKTYYYNEDGERLDNETRPCTKEELRQMSIVREIRAEGTND